jgi:hypothetical protein
MGQRGPWRQTNRARLRYRRVAVRQLNRHCRIVTWPPTTPFCLPTGSRSGGCFRPCAALVAIERTSLPSSISATPSLVCAALAGQAI